MQTQSHYILKLLLFCYWIDIIPIAMALEVKKSPMSSSLITIDKILIYQGDFRDFHFSIWDEKKKANLELILNGNNISSLSQNGSWSHKCQNSKVGDQWTIQSSDLENGFRWNQHHLPKYTKAIVKIKRHVSGKLICQLFLEFLLEEYVSLVVIKEVNPKWPIELLKAQAVVARTYALYQILHRQRLFLHNSQMDQVHGFFQGVNSTVLEAVRDTQGMILVSREKDVLWPIFYGAQCGGVRRQPNEVWSPSLVSTGGSPIDLQFWNKSLTQQTCQWCQKHTDQFWEFKVSTDQWKNILFSMIKPENMVNSTNKKKELDIHYPPDHLARAYLIVYIDGKRYKLNKEKIRESIGRYNIKSNRFSLKVFQENGKENILLKGIGNGHGVGMCQVGAWKMSEVGKSYLDILNFYYPDYKLRINERMTMKFSNLKESQFFGAQL